MATDKPIDKLHEAFDENNHQIAVLGLLEGIDFAWNKNLSTLLMLANLLSPLNIDFNNHGGGFGLFAYYIVF